MKRKSKCCQKYRKKSKACKSCPLIAALGGDGSRRKRTKALRKLAAAALLP